MYYGTAVPVVAASLALSGDVDSNDPYIGNLDIEAAHSFSDACREQPHTSRDV